MAGFTRKDGAIRFYDGTATTPQYIHLNFDEGDFAAPLAVPAAEETLVLPRGKMSPGAHYLVKSDEPIMAAIELNFKLMLTDDANCQNFLALIQAMNDGGTTPINANTWVTTKGTTMRDGVTPNPPFADANKRTGDLVYLLNNGVGGALGRRYNEVWIAPDSKIEESADGAAASIRCLCYGTIAQVIAWPTGVSIEA
jgi:hypothetical protein